MAARRTPGWREFPDQPTPQPHEVELLGLGVLVTVFERMGAAERRRCLAYLDDRYGVVDAEIVEEPPAVTRAEMPRWGAAP